jgi:parallel beta-helix repeat protein
MSGDDTKDGKSWANAFRTLQQALATAGVSGDQIWVAAGTYYPDEGNGATDNDRTSSFNLKNNVAIYGGFAGTETMLSQRNWATNVTVLSGDLQQNDGANFANNGDNAYHVVQGNGVNGSAVLDGFTIQGANANITGNDVGGGMLNSNGATPAISNCIFIANTATDGGGMSIFDSSPALTNCLFSGNVCSFNGGGISSHNSSPKVTNCTFSRNFVSNRGGGMYNFQNSSPVLTNCTFLGNTSSGSGGGIENLLGSSSMLTNCSFSGNSAASGGGLFNGSDGPPSSATLINCIL